MPERLRLVEVNYHHHAEYTTPQDVIEKHRPSNCILEVMGERMDVHFVKHAAFRDHHEQNGLHYRFFEGKNSFFHLPFATHDYVASLNPDIVLVQGFHFPVQVIHLRKKLGRHCHILLQHQGDLPGGKKQWLQRLADNAVDAYLFRSKGNALAWQESGIIRDEKKILEVPDASTTFRKQDKQAGRKELNIEGSPVFLWVGRLDANKDPLTVLRAFEIYVQQNPGARLYMIYGDAALENEAKAFINEKSLGNNIICLGRIMHNQMQAYYSAADYFISASHHEGGSYALTEAMACGCIPIVSAISPSLQTIGDGAAGYSFATGDHQSLSEILLHLDNSMRESMSNEVENRFWDHLSAEAVAKELYALLSGLMSNKAITSRAVLASG